MESTTVPSKKVTVQVDYDGRVTIPKVVRQALSIHANDIIDMEIYGPEKKRR